MAHYIWRQFAEETDIHGVYRMANREHSLIVRFLWLISIMFSSIFLVYLAVDTTLLYFNYDTVIVTYQNIDEVPLPWISFCPKRSLKEAVGEFQDVSEFKKFVDNVSLKPSDIFSRCKAEHVSKETYTGSCHDNLCGDDLSATYLQPTWLYPYGRCYILHNNNTYFSQTRSGSTAGLTISLKPATNSKKYSLTSTNDGSLRDTIVMLIHQPLTSTEVSHSAVEPLEIDLTVHSGVEIEILTTQLFTRLGLPYEHCIDSKDLTLIDTYTRAKCQYECMTSSFASYYSCILYDMENPSSRNYSLCSLQQKVEEYVDYREDVYHDCKESCLPACKTWKYKFTHSLSSDTHYNQSSGVTIHLKASAGSDFVEYSQEPRMLPIPTLANLGGMMGLFLGMSVLSIVHLIKTLVLYMVGVSCSGPWVQRSGWRGRQGKVISRMKK